MQQDQVRQYVERYLASFSSHIVEAHPDYLTVKLPVEVDKDIGNRPFYWSWVEKMNLAYQPLILTFAFHPEASPEGQRAEYLHLGAGRMHQIFDSTKKHGQFVCMYEQVPREGLLSSSGKRRSTPLVPWLGLNLKVSLLCDKKRDILLYMGVNLHEPRIVHDFPSVLYRLPLSPAIPDYCFTLERRITIPQATSLVQQEVAKMLEKEDQSWAQEARTRLEEERAILQAYYEELALREKEPENQAEESSPDQPETEESLPVEPENIDHTVEAPKQTASLDEYRSTGGRILDFLRANGIPVTPREQIDQTEWRKSTPSEERQRRMDELSWQYEPRIEIKLINAGLFYLHSTPQTRRIL